MDTAPRQRDELPEATLGTPEAIPASTGSHPEPTVASRASALLRTARPKQWLKNVLVFAAPAAAGLLGHERILVRSSITFVAFCLVSSAMYMVNDVVDREHDASHPVKRLRPVASGALPVRTALIAAVLLVVAGGGAAAAVGWPVLGVVAAYVALTGAYSLWLKPIAVLDIGAIALGFVLRSIGGSVATHVSDSKWFLILVSFGSLFVVAGKRYADEDMTEAPSASRSPVAYTASYLRFVWTMSAGVAVAAYCLWAFSSAQAVDTPGWAQVSAIPFVLAILRYALMLESGLGGAPEDLLLSDRTLQVLSALWLATYLVGVYVGT